ncbi:FkbM family methyltransferase [Knoellia sp. S7-12]|uniref:FkbM family methyltransferase n=1 Tax=Knoellia sp. S7-12 TaxID=3126698 RepID=UPI003365F7F8
MIAAQDQTRIEYRDQVVLIDGAGANDHISKEIRTTGRFYESELLNSVEPLLSAGDFVVDVGANIGNHSLYWAAVCEAEVLAVEPEETVFSVLRRNIALNRLAGRIFPRNFALGDTDGVATVVRGKEENLGQTRVDVDLQGTTIVRRLDGLHDVAERTVRLVKIDVEGMELDVLRGAEGVLKRDRPALLVECLDEAHLESVLLFLRPMSYHVVDCFNASPTYLLLSTDWRYPSDYSPVQHQRDIVGRLAKELVLQRIQYRALNRRLL